MITSLLLLIGSCGMAAQPAVAPASNENHWVELLKQQWDLDMNRDLRNPVLQKAPAALFVKVEESKPVTFVPLIALGLETTTRGGWYAAGPKAIDLPEDVVKVKVESWAYTFKQPRSQMESGQFTPPPLQSGEPTFDPGVRPFGLWVSNDALQDGGVFTQPGLVAKVNERLRSQPYKAMIYPNYDKKARRVIPHSYLIGWEYSTNDDFQDVVTRIDNVRLLPGEPVLGGVLREGATVQKLAGGFKFVEGPAWDFRNNVLYFSDIPNSAIVAYSNDRARVAKTYAGQTNGLMFDRDGKLLGCEHAGRRVSRDVLSDQPQPLATHYQGKKLNSPNDLWIDAAGGIYFTDPRYGPRDDLELDKEAVYYMAPAAAGTAALPEPRRVATDSVRPNGIAISPSGKHLYVIDNGGGSIYRYPIEEPGRLGPAELIAHVGGGDGMTIDKDGRLYITAHEGIAVLAPDGKWLGAIACPEQPANCTFGDKDMSTLYITARTSLYSIPTQTRGWHATP